MGNLSIQSKQKMKTAPAHLRFIRFMISHKRICWFGAWQCLVQSPIDVSGVCGGIRRIQAGLAELRFGFQQPNPASHQADEPQRHIWNHDCIAARHAAAWRGWLVVQRSCFLWNQLSCFMVSSSAWWPADFLTRAERLSVWKCSREEKSIFGLQRDWS